MSKGGLGFVGGLTLLFIALKLFKVTAVANWSWLWVLSPMWISFSLSIGIVILWALVLVGGNVWITQKVRSKK